MNKEELIEQAKRDGDRIDGFLEVGLNDRGEVVINLPEDKTGHLVFSPRQAHHLAMTLRMKAEEADPNLPTASLMFIKDCLRTESIPDNPLQYVSAAMVVQSLMLAAATGATLDTIKRGVFYGKGFNGSALDTALNQIGVSITNMREQIGRHRDEVWGEKFPFSVRLFHCVVGTGTEAGELADCLVEAWLQNRPVDKVNFLEELADSRWYQSVGIDEMGGNEQEMLNAVIRKLKKRYPEKFDADKAVNRDLLEERKALEGTGSASSKYVLVRKKRNLAPVSVVQFDGTWDPIGVQRDAGRPFVTTIHEQPVYIEPGDWIFPEPDGKHFYPVKSSFFDEHYERVG